jgi:hypothetical protein
VKIEVVALTYAHLLQMGEIDLTQNSRHMAGPAFCMLADGEPVAAGGIVRQWDNVGKGWTLHTERARSSFFLMRNATRIVKTLAPIVRDAMGLERLEAETWAQPKYCSWLSHLGFVAEGVMRKYKNGEDFMRFAWIR